MKKFFTVILATLTLSFMNGQKFEEKTYTDKQGYQYIQVENDQNGVRIYTLKNGLKVYLAKNEDAPRIQTYIPVRTGSNNDPIDNTGLAHYLEHMLFKGTSKLGTLDWDKEQALLKQISDLYEEHKKEKDPQKKKAIYKRIDEVSQEASKYAIASEYDKAVGSLGASGTNAHTWLDETVYHNNIPSNELEKWLKIEKERFSELVLRLFHTELETVYEEFNRAQDNDARLVNYALMDALFPMHPNGQQTTLGKGEHLKNPSMEAIHKYFNTYYVPNNMAVVLVGDLDFDSTIKLVDNYFGNFKYKELPSKKTIVEEPMKQVAERKVKSPSNPRLQMAWRTNHYGTQEYVLANVVSKILSNSGDAGLIDLNINQQQKALGAGAYTSGYKEYGMLAMSIVPKNDQTLDQAKQLLLDQVELVKKGDFPDWLIPAIINEMKLQRMKSWETVTGLASNLYKSFIYGKTWKEELDQANAFGHITKADVVQFANDFFKDNYAIVYKEKGINDQLVRVENPGISPIKINRQAQSAFLKDILNTKPSREIQPQFIDYKKEITEGKIQDKKVSFVPNKYNSIAQVHYIYPMGRDNGKELGLMVTLLEYLGTNKYSPSQLKQEFYKLGISNGISVGNDQIIISLTGLEENMKKGVELLNHWISNVKPDDAIYQQTIKTILDGRDYQKKDKTSIMRALTNYAKFGENSRFTDVLSQKEMENIKVNTLTDGIKKLKQYPYEVFVYGNDFNKLKQATQVFVTKETLKVPAAKVYPEPNTNGKVYFTNYDMVQVEMGKVGRANVVDIKNTGKINVFNEYFGSGLSSIVFQELRESQSLAYSAYVNYSRANELNKHDYVASYIGTQPDKLDQAVNSMNVLMSDLPQIPDQFENAKNSQLKNIASSRVNRTNIYFNTLALKKLGLDYDIRKDTYGEVSKLTLPTLTDFYNTQIKPIKYNAAIIGNKESLDMKAIGKMGDFVEVSLEQIFGF